MPKLQGRFFITWMKRPMNQVGLQGASPIVGCPCDAWPLWTGILVITTNDWYISIALIISRQYNNTSCFFHVKDDMHMSRLMTKPTMWLCAQRRLRSASAYAQSDQSSLSAWRKLASLATHWAHSEDSDRLGRCPGWSKSSLGTHSLCWFCHEVAHIFSVHKVSTAGVRWF